MTARLPELTAEQIEATARTLRVTDFVTGAGVQWIPTAMQLAYWRFEQANRRGFVGKPRRAYISTAADLSDVMNTLACDVLGHRVRTGVMLDTEIKIRERMWQMSDFLRQMNVPHEASDSRIVFGRGSEIVGLTAGGKRTAASTGFQRMRYSEASYYSDEQAITATSASVGKNGREMIETTVDIGAANGRQAKKIWDDPDNDFATLFLPCEMHPEYRMDPGAISDDEWTWSQSEGFTDRGAAAYWLRELVPNKCAGDVIKAMHEYPQLPRHMFTASSGLWVRRHPRVLSPLRHLRVVVPSATTEAVAIWVEPADVVGDVIIGVDTATGADLDRMAIAAVDTHTRKLLASWVSGTATGDDAASVARALYEHYTREDTQANKAFATDPWPLRYPRVVIEDNTTGQITIQPARRLGFPFDAFDTTQDSKYLGLLETKRLIEMGTIEGPQELKDECEQLIRDEHGKWKGKKDLLMAIGFCVLRISSAPPMVGPTHVVMPERTIDIKSRIRRYARSGRR